MKKASGLKVASQLRDLTSYATVRDKYDTRTFYWSCTPILAITGSNRYYSLFMVGMRNVRLFPSLCSLSINREKRSRENGTCTNKMNRVLGFIMLCEQSVSPPPNLDWNTLFLVTFGCVHRSITISFLWELSFIIHDVPSSSFQKALSPTTYFPIHPPKQWCLY